MARIPHAARLAALPAPEQYAAVELFRGTMLRHSVVAVPRRRRGAAARASRALPATTGSATCRFECPTRSVSRRSCRRARPAGLINPNHAYTDIYLPIDAREKRLYDAVDGARAIVRSRGPKVR
jgi:hypothetical protein